MRPALAVVLLLVSCSCSRAVDTTIHDAGITADIKTVLLNDAEIDATRVDVRTIAGVVYLEGFARTPADAERIAALVRGVDGVREVTSRISVEPLPTPRF